MIRSLIGALAGSLASPLACRLGAAALLLPLCAAAQTPAALRAPLPAATTAAEASDRGTLAWVTIDEAALQVLRKVDRRARVLGSVELTLEVQAERSRELRLVPSSERIHAVEMSEALLEGLSMLNHRELRRCAGFLRHESMAEALATLHRVEQAARGVRAPQLAERAVNYAIDDEERTRGLLPRVQSSNILSTITQLSNFQNRRHNSSFGIDASNWLFAQWQALKPAGRDDVRVSQVTHGNTPQKSVMFEFLGRGPNRAEVVVLGAHLDSINGSSLAARAPGADDDASGVASLTEIIRVLASTGFRPRRTVRFYAYAAEEVGLWGSQAIAAQQAGQGTPVVGVLQLDMVAYKGDATDIWIYTDYTNAAQNAFLASLVQAYLPGLSIGYDRCGYGCSDHAAWHNRGFVASFPFEASNTTYNFALHTVNDTTATFGNQAEHALKFARLALAYAVELGTD